ncbi:MAG TPA: Spy/CpxP family protein refolding chaperone [Gemmatimonadales bacterium]|nr:Spy/CpxP family protein refolding chaperone [Gemmatimonadales bacterium]
MRGPALWVLLLAAAAGPLAAQGEQDTLPRSRELRDRIEQRFAERVKQELALSDEQATKLKTIAMEYGGRRRELRHRERDLRAALDAQIRDGTTSDQDSVAWLTRELLDLRVEYAESWREEMGRLSPFLTPVQRARLLVMRERLIQRVHEMRGDRRGFRHRGDGH